MSVAGVWAGLRMPSSIYPELQFPRATVVVEGSSLSARQVVFSITRPLEEAISTVLGVRRVDSKSIRGGSEIKILFAPGTDMIYALQLVQAEVNQVRPELPPGLTIRADRITPSVYPILSYNLEGGDPATLYDMARYQIKPLISRVPGVGHVEVQGSDVREVEVVADPARLAAQGLTYDDLASSIRDAIGLTAVGRVDKDYKQYLVVTANDAHSVDDIANVVVGHGLRVRDLATVTFGTTDHAQIIDGDGHPAALINITRQIGGNTVAIADSVAAIARNVAASLPPGVHLKAVYDQAELVRDAVIAVRDAMLIGALLAMVILLLFLRHARITAISAASIPLTMVITVFVMSLLGQTFNLMTLGAMAIAIGLVIDDAVVITENIVRHLHLTSDRRVGHPRRRPGTHLAGDDVDDHHGRRVPAARPARGRRRPVLQRAVAHADDRRAGVARARAHHHSAAERAVPHGARRRIRGRSDPTGHKRGILACGRDGPWTRCRWSTSDRWVRCCATRGG